MKWNSRRYSAECPSCSFPYYENPMASRSCQAQKSKCKPPCTEHLVASAYWWCDNHDSCDTSLFVFSHVVFEFELVNEKGYWLEPFFLFSYVRLWGLSTSQHDPCFSKRSRVELRTVCLLWSTFLVPAVSWPSVRRDWLRQTLKHICWSCAKALFIKTMWK